MNPITTIQTKAAGTIQYSRALSTKQAEGEAPMSLVSTQAFRVPWALLKHDAPHSRSEVAARDKVDDQAGGTPASTSAAQKHNALLASPDDGAIESWDFILEELRQRSQAKTLTLEEALQRSERSQRRFWGINE